MALNLRKRYEILKRDHFTCLYCGARPPGVDLVVDHVRSRADGGTDEPGNLLTACFTCNSGKGAISVSTCESCVRPICRGPSNPRDDLEAGCKCDCHGRCAGCGAVDSNGIPSNGICAACTVAEEEMTHDVSVEEGFE